MMSFAPSSCLPNPICQDKNITFAPSDYNNSHQFWPILLYNGNSSNAPFTLDYGYLGKGPEGVLLELTEQSQTKISTTDYMLYGNIQLSARHNALAGLVFAFITMSDIKDEIDWEFTTANAEDAQTNYFSQGVTVKGSAQSINASSSVSDWHTYGLNWQENQLQWSIDGNVVRTLTRSQAGTNYPRSPSRVQISVWAGGNSTNPPGVIQWAGGAIDWTSSAYTSPGYYSAEIRSFQTTCASQSNLNETTVGNGNTTTSWVYTGQMSDNEPQFALSNDPISYLASPQDDAPPGLPGYSVQSAFTKSNSNAWDGSGDTSGLSQKDVTGKGSTSNNLNSSGGWLANNRTLSIAVPVVAGAISLAVMWALCVCLFRRYKKRENGNNVLANSGVPLKDGSVGFNNINSSSNKGTRYEALYDDEDEASENEAMYADPTPMGAQRVGKGYGPASGPRPGPMNRQEWSDSSSSLYGADEYAMSEQNLGYAQSPQRFQQQTPQFQPQFQQQMPQRQPPQQMQRQPPPQPIPQSPQYQQRRYPASPAINQFATPGTPGTPFTPYPNGGVRGPYTPGMNAYTPALHQTPAALQASFAPSQVNYNPPQRMNGYDQQCQQSYQRQQQQQQQQYPRYR
ncbi:concanavalin A-like lectin/glucanase [Meira miltonrushii]|uniref:Concanavalin A-like lectin/glucanase n=1 Tax=Meira miltonrushii TaxID=1280837 RepID=A0A316VFN2_9BASI|nr:concanavalin A-like lectin/glucanase [Meira miltonrushii]PWN34811.1 concanavalin A-like lectin/glucanase [Meira miltonrushii]